MAATFSRRRCTSFESTAPPPPLAPKLVESSPSVDARGNAVCMLSGDGAAPSRSSPQVSQT